VDEGIFPGWRPLSGPSNEREDRGTSTGARDQPVGNEPRVPPPVTSAGQVPPRAGGASRRASLGLRLRALALTVLLIVVTLGIGWLVWSVLEWRHGRTPAYRILGVRVVRRSDGRRAGLARMARRELCCALLIVPTIVACSVVALSFVMGASPPNGLFRSPRTAPWDRLSDSQVVEDRRRHHLVLGGDWLADGPVAGASTGQRQN
jgi:RDD family